MPTLFEARKQGRRDPPGAVYIAEAEPPAKGRRIITDSHRNAPRGFALRLNANGSKVFVLRYAIAGKDRLLSVGEVGTWSLAAARKKAAEYRQEIDSGLDILESRRADREEPTVSDVCHRFLNAKRQTGMKSHDDIAGLFRRYVLPEIGQQRMKNLRRRDVIALVEHVAAATPRQASMLLAYIKQLVAWAEDREIIEANPVATLRAEKVSAALAQRPRSRILDHGEIRNFWLNVDGCGMHRLTALALRTILATGQRPGEVAAMHWNEIEDRLWTIPGHRRKTRVTHTLPLGDLAMELLAYAAEESARLRKRRRNAAVGYIFETRPGRPITTAALSRAVTRYAAVLGNKDADGGHWKPHDLRRTCRTGLSATGTADHISEIVIGHARQGIAAVYDLHRYDAEKRAALEAWERRLLRIAEGLPADDNVVPMSRP